MKYEGVKISFNKTTSDTGDISKFEFPRLDVRNDGEKKALFERRITHRIRLSRMACVQALYMSIINIASSKLSNKTQRSLFDLSDEEVRPEIFCRSVIYVYKNYILGKKSYGDNIKNKRIDEKFLFDVVEFAHENAKIIDKYISKHLSLKWDIENLDFTIKAILRCAIAESMIFPSIETAILTSEYTNLATYFFSGKQVGFVNGVLHSYCNERRNERRNQPEKEEQERRI